MKKTFAICAALVGLCANADYLYWMVDTDSAASYQYDSAILKTSGGESLATINSTVAELQGYSGDTLNARISSYQFDAGGFVSTIASSYASGTTFFIELYNGSSWLAQSTPIPYSSIAGSIYSGGTGLPTGTPASFGAYAVPEPTSGLLFLLGGMLLGLRRRRRV